MLIHRLPPQSRRVEPRCTDFADEALVEAYELAMREHRARSEAFSVEPLEPRRRDTTWRVASPSGATYLVDIVDDSATYDGCTCADFATNRLGTCKHVAAVRRALADLPRLRRLPAVGAPGVPTLVVDARGPRPRLRLVGPRSAPLARRLDAADGEVDPRALDRLPASVRVTHAARAIAERLRESADRRRRSEEVERALAAGRFSLDLLRRPLFPYQERGVAHLVGGGRALLADDMGLGKTVQAIAACEALRLRGESDRVLVLTPATLKAQWAREIERYAQRGAVVVEGNAKRRRAAIAGGAPYVIVNYELLWRDLDLARAVGADVIVLDEAQRAKNFRTKTATLLRALPSRFLFVLTGTPVENRLDDLYSLMQLVDPEVLGPLWRFNLDFHVQTTRTRRSGYRNLATLRQRLAPHVLRRRKEEVLAQLPPLVENTRYVALSPRQAELEHGLRKDAAPLMAAAQRRPLTPAEQQRLMALLLKARQACNAAALCDPALAGDGSGKLDELEALVGEIVEQGAAKVLVFSEWTEMLRLAAARLEQMGVGFGFLHGGVPNEKRAALIERFRDEPGERVLLSTDAGGVGLNLQAASYVIHLDLPWNPGRLDQRTARAHRLGQTRGVSVTYLCAASGIERGIEGTLAGKRAVRGAALDADSDVDRLDAPSFTGFVRELEAAMAHAEGAATEAADAEEAEADMADAGEAEADMADAGEAEADTAIAAEIDTAEADAADFPAIAPLPSASGHAVASTIAPRRAEATPPPHAAPPPAAIVPTGAARAHDRLRLADVVLAAGFAGDAVRAAYDALAAQLRAALPEPAGASHAGLVAAAYRLLVPTGRAPEGLMATLARLHDLTLLESEGVATDARLAAEAVAEARGFVDRLAPPETSGATTALERAE